MTKALDYFDPAKKNDGNLSETLQRHHVSSWLCLLNLIGDFPQKDPKKS